MEQFHLAVHKIDGRFYFSKKTFGSSIEKIGTEAASTVMTGRLAAVAAALLLHDVALAGGVAVEGGAAAGDLAAARVRPGAALALEAHRRPRCQRPCATARDRRQRVLRRPHRHHVRIPCWSSITAEKTISDRNRKNANICSRACRAATRVIP